MFKGMGFEPVLDKDGVVSKMLVRKFHFTYVLLSTFDVMSDGLYRRTVRRCTLR
jgi:hypothetical protein